MSRSGPSQEQIDVCTQSNITGTQNMLLAARDVPGLGTQLTVPWCRNASAKFALPVDLLAPGADWQEQPMRGKSGPVALAALEP